MSGVDRYQTPKHLQQRFIIFDSKIRTLLPSLSSWKRNAEALEQIEKDIRVKPTTDLWNDKGVILSRMKRYDLANEAFDVASGLDPKDATPLYNKALNYHKAGDNEEAVKYADEAGKLNPNHDETWGVKGNAHYRLGEYRESVEAHSKAIKVNPRYQKSYYSRGVARLKVAETENRIEETTKALDDLAKAVELDPDLKDTAREDVEYKSLWNDERFKEIVK